MGVIVVKTKRQRTEVKTGSETGTVHERMWRGHVLDKWQGQYFLFLNKQVIVVKTKRQRTEVKTGSETGTVHERMWRVHVLDKWQGQYFLFLNKH